ncbi:hypothetical protein BD777DRAFT_135586 [Yarrowia lipolytica]|nr:hypothetical protein BD777DRAFT_135586 [Yarrowia lipolytica]
MFLKVAECTGQTLGESSWKQLHNITHGTSATVTIMRPSIPPGARIRLITQLGSACAAFVSSPCGYLLNILYYVPIHAHLQAQLQATLEPPESNSSLGTRLQPDLVQFIKVTLVERYFHTVGYNTFNGSSLGENCPLLRHVPVDEYRASRGIVLLSDFHSDGVLM